ncbi:hypothetical protein V2J09_004407 [Rumex salicifolius]
MDGLKLCFLTHWTLKKIWENRPYHVSGQLLKQWFPGFEPQNESISKLDLWIRIHKLPSEYANSDALSAILELNDFGTFIRLDPLHAKRKWMTFTQLCVSTDVQFTMGRKIIIPDEFMCEKRYNVWFDDFPLGCGACGERGHDFDSCPDRGIAPPKLKITLPKPSFKSLASSSSTALEPSGKGWIEVGPKPIISNKTHLNPQGLNPYLAENCGVTIIYESEESSQEITAPISSEQTLNNNNNIQLNEGVNLLLLYLLPSCCLKCHHRIRMNCLILGFVLFYLLYLETKILSTFPYHEPSLSGCLADDVVLIGHLSNTACILGKTQHILSCYILFEYFYLWFITVSGSLHILRKIWYFLNLIIKLNPYYQNQKSCRMEKIIIDYNMLTAPYYFLQFKIIGLMITCQLLCFYLITNYFLSICGKLEGLHGDMQGTVDAVAPTLTPKAITPTMVIQIEESEHEESGVSNDPDHIDPVDGNCDEEDVEIEFEPIEEKTDLQDDLLDEYEED